MAHILVVEDEPHLALALQRGLQDEHHAVDVQRDGLAAYEQAGTGIYDLVLLDVMLPGMSGIALCRRLRASGVRTPILMLTARDSGADVVTGLDAGADDYLTKPFAFDVLLARVRALLRRAVGEASPRFREGPLELDPAAHRAFVDGKLVELTAKELQLLEVLLRRHGRVQSRADLAEAAWEIGLEPESNVVEVHLSSLRKKLGPGLIHTVRGAGYVLRWEPS